MPGAGEHRPAHRVGQLRHHTVARWLIWSYVLLLLGEGALRKWIFPQLSSPLLIIRDPLVIAIYAVALAGGFFPRSGYVIALGMIALLASIAGFLAEAFSLPVFLFGLRSNFLHLPLIFVIARVMTYEDVIRLGRWILLLSIPMAYLVVRQFAAAPDDILNVGAGMGARQIASAGGKVRASGTFSFVTGVVAFYSFVAAFLLQSMVQPGRVPHWLQFAGVGGLIAAVATSGSRAAVWSVVIVALALVFLLFRSPQFLGRVVMVMAVLALVGGAAAQLGVVEEGLQNLTTRFEEAGGQGGISSRIVESFTNPFNQTLHAPLFGYGLGLGTNAGSSLATGRVEFLLAEDEWSRVIMESGPLVGILFIAWRVALVLSLFRLSSRALRLHNVLPLLLLAASGFLIVTGQFGQPTTLGFAAIGGGLCAAALRPSPAPARRVGRASADGEVGVAKDVHPGDSHRLLT